MPIYENEKGTQIRVAVSVGGKLRQKYFHPKTPEALDKNRKAANRLETEWKFEANIIASDRKRQRKETGKSSAFVTGVSGIKMKFVVDTKKRPVQGAKTKRKRKIRYYTPSFVVSGSHNNKLFCKAFNIKALGFDMAWFRAVNYLCATKEIYSMDKLQKKRPPVEQFAVIYKWQSQQGHVIPKERLPEEFLKKDTKGELASYIST
ncbi:MAG: hypothetical protein V3U84_09510 [Thiotrichaceae bacterium]